MKSEISTPEGIIKIRTGQLSDLRQFKELRLFALKESPAAFGAGYEISAKRPLSYWKNRLKPDEHSILVFAEYNKTLIGMTGIYKGDSKQTSHGTTIWGVYVLPDWRGQQIAGAMIELCCEWAKLRGAKVAKLGVMANNTAAIRSYEGSGFKIYAREPYAIQYDGEYFEGLFMLRVLSDI